MKFNLHFFVACFLVFILGCSSDSDDESLTINDIQAENLGICLSNQFDLDFPLDKVYSINCSSWSIDDVSEIGKFPNLSELRLYWNNIQSIDLSKNTKLTFLDLSNNPIHEIDLSKNTELTYVALEESNITRFDLSNSPNLSSLYIGFNLILQLALHPDADLVEFGAWMDAQNCLAIVAASQTTSALDGFFEDYCAN